MEKNGKNKIKNISVSLFIMSNLKEMYYLYLLKSAKNNNLNGILLIDKDGLCLEGKFINISFNRLWRFK